MLGSKGQRYLLLLYSSRYLSTTGAKNLNYCFQCSIFGDCVAWYWSWCWCCCYFSAFSESFTYCVYAMLYAVCSVFFKGDTSTGGRWHTRFFIDFETQHNNSIKESSLFAFSFILFIMQIYCNINMLYMRGI